MTLPDFLTEWPGNQIVITGHRIGLYHIVKHYNEGESSAQLAERYPTLAIDLIQHVVSFYEANRVEVDAYVAEYRAEIDRQAALPSPGPSFEELKRRMAAKRSAESA